MISPEKQNKLLEQVVVTYDYKEKQMAYRNLEKKLLFEQVGFSEWHLGGLYHRYKSNFGVQMEILRVNGVWKIQRCGENGL